MRQYHEAVDAAVVEARLKAFFEDDPRGAVAVYLFGSVARGDAGLESDVDVGILFAEDPPATLGAPQFAIEAALERRVGSPVQVVALNRASPDLVHRVLRDGHLVLDRDRAARIRFEAKRRAASGESFWMYSRARRASDRARPAQTTSRAPERDPVRSAPA
jgi:predicted nucleotidyltransferase